MREAKGESWSAWKIGSACRSLRQSRRHLDAAAKIVNSGDQIALARMSAPLASLLALLPDLCPADAAARRALRAGPCRPADIDPLSRKPFAAYSSTLSVRVPVRHRP